MAPLLHFQPPQVLPFMGHGPVPTGGGQHRLTGVGRDIPLENPLVQHAPFQPTPSQYVPSQYVKGFTPLSLT